jgi:hypothetical protein
MQKFFLLCILISASINAHGQQLDPTVVATSGNHLISSGYQLSFTLGETVIATLVSDEHTLTQGFHQTELTITSVLETPEIVVQLFPVPARDLVYIKFSSPNNLRHFNLFDMSGKQINSGSINPTAELFELPVAHLANGTYILNLKFDYNIIQPYKIQVTR